MEVKATVTVERIPAAVLIPETTGPMAFLKRMTLSNSGSVTLQVITCDATPDAAPAVISVTVLPETTTELNVREATSEE